MSELKQLQLAVPIKVLFHRSNQFKTEIEGSAQNLISCDCKRFVFIISAGKLNALEEFRVQQDELNKKFAELEAKLNQKDLDHDKEIYDLERKAVIEKDRCVRFKIPVHFKQTKYWQILVQFGISLLI